MSDPLLTPAEAARFLRVSPSTLARWRCYGQGPGFVKVPHAVRYRRTVLAGWLRAHQHLTGAEASGEGAE